MGESSIKTHITLDAAANNIIDNEENVWVNNLVIIKLTTNNRDHFYVGNVKYVFFVFLLNPNLTEITQLSSNFSLATKSQMTKQQVTRSLQKRAEIPTHSSP